MTRKKVKLAFIESSSRRKACYRKRKKGLVKKIEELTTLCGVQACIIIYSHYDEEQPEIWPPSHADVQDIIGKFRELSVGEQNRKMLSQEGFTLQRMRKNQEQYRKLSRSNRQKEIKLYVSECFAGEPRRDFTLPDLNEMRWSIFFSMQNIARQIQTVKRTLYSESQDVTGVNSSTTPQNERFPGIGNGRTNPFVAPGIPMYYSKINPLWGLNFTGVDKPPAYFLNGSQPRFPQEMPMTNYLANPLWGMNVMMQNNSNIPAVAPGMPTNYLYNPTPVMTTLVQNQQFAGFNIGGYNPLNQQMQGNNSAQNPIWGMNTVVQHDQQSANFSDGYFVSPDPDIPNNDPQNLSTEVNEVAPPPQEQSADAGDIDWISFLFGDDDAGSSSAFP